jgi:aspartate oxidase
VASDRGAERDHGGGVVGWRVLIQALVRTVVIEMAHVVVKNSSGVSFVVDQQPVGALGADAAHEAFRIAVRPGRAGGIFTTVMPSEAKTASKAAVNLQSRSRIRKWKPLI